MKRLAAALLVVGLAGSAYALPAEPPAAATSNPMAKHAGRRLQVSAHARGLLYPGVRRALPVRLVNPSRRLVVVRSVAVTVASAPRGCPPSSVRIGRYRGGRLRVPPRADATARMSVRMAADAPDACQGVAFRLAVRVRARVAKRR